MSGKSKPLSSCSCPELAAGQRVGAGGRGAAARLPQEESEAQGRGRRAHPSLGDPAIVKSPSDPKHYRYLMLQNGLCALLISDANNMDSVPSEESSEWEDNDETEIETDEDDDSGAEMDEDKENYEDDDNDGDDEEDPNNSDDMEMEELTEKEEAKKRSGTEKLSAAALCVAVGSFCDPEDLPGLAHFLEHMVFMGSLKYPDENGFDAFLKKHGGSDNASTDCERTVFHFDIQQKYFKEALDRWAQFFIHPLMIRDAIDREVEAVDSEYQLARPSDANRRELLLGSLARPGHPMKKFFWGNAETLKHEPKKSNTDIYTRLRDFWQHYYSAHYMNVVVQSKETLDTLEKWVKEIFSQIPNNGLPKPNFGHLTQPFDTPEFYKLYRVVPIRNVHSLSIAWGLPPQERHYRVKPLHYISWLVGHEGKGSVLSFLRKKFWALALYGGNGETGFEQNSTYSIFSISVTLTDEGYEHFYEVAHVVFQYLKMLQKRGPDKRIWEEIQKIEANEFYFQDQADPIDYVESLCENIHIFCKEDFLTGDQLLLEYKPEIIADVLNQLCPLRANLVLLSAASERKCHLKERWFGTQYSVEDIDKSWSDLWASDFQLNQDLHLPEENKYIATDFSLKASDWPDTEHPVKILSTHHGCVWYKKDNKFKIPKAYIRFHLISPLIQQSAKRDVRSLILEHGKWSMVDRYRRLMKGLYTESLSSFVKGFKSHLYVEGLVQGNFTSRESKDFLNYVVLKLQFLPLPHPCPVQFRVVDLPNTHLLCKVKTLNRGDANSEVTVYYQSGARSLREYTLMELLVMHMEEPCFNFLRTKQTLGYHVYPTCRNTSGILGFSVTVTTQATKNNSEFVDKKIEEFLLYFEGKMRLLTEKAFRTQVSALIHIKECEDSYLGEEVDRNWNEIMTQQYLFDRLAHEVEALRSVTKSDLVDWFQAHRGKERKALSIHVVGFGKQEGDSDVQQSLLGEIYQLTFLPPSSYMKNTSYIRDIRNFTLMLNLLPYHKILK
ncbi:nardilysin-like isoform X1 [Chrysemys picta bellii]|uniref:nardilysin-like isoform X1 n=1 Tax=Chrysemys picta bellii TaxID=8478 RepID=UPI0032B29527